MKSKTEVKTLCYRCKGDYESTGDYYIRRTDPKRKIKSRCDYCSVRDGHDYELTPKAGRRGIDEHND